VVQNQKDFAPRLLEMERRSARYEASQFILTRSIDSSISYSSPERQNTSIDLSPIYLRELSSIGHHNECEIKLRALSLEALEMNHVEL
jgi:hypothetical protein